MLSIGFQNAATRIQLQYSDASCSEEAQVLWSRSSYRFQDLGPSLYSTAWNVGQLLFNNATLGPSSLDYVALLNDECACAGTCARVFICALHGGSTRCRDMRVWV